MNPTTISRYSIAFFAISFFIGLTSPITALAATTPSLGAAASYAILGSTYTNTSATTVNGDVGFTTGPAVTPLGTHSNYGSGSPYATAGSDQGAALSNLASEPCTFTFAGGAINLATDTTHGAIGVYAPGVYCSSGAMDVGGPLTLSGGGTFIFRPVGALTSTAGATVTLTGASACDVFWTPSGATTLAANTTFVGTLIGNAGVTLGANTLWTGRSLAFGGTVTTDTNTINVPACSAPVVVPPALATLRVVKQVINNNGGIATASSFNLRVRLSGSDVAGSPAAGVASPGRSYTLAAGTYVISEDVSASYTRSFGGACDSNGSVILSPGDNVTCTLINDDVAPIVVSTATSTVITPVIAPTPVVANPVLSTTVIPTLPNTGLPPQKSSAGMGFLILLGVMGSIFYYLVRKNVT